MTVGQRAAQAADLDDVSVRCAVLDEPTPVSADEKWHGAASRFRPLELRLLERDRGAAQRDGVAGEEALGAVDQVDHVGDACRRAWVERPGHRPLRWGMSGADAEYC